MRALEAREIYFSVHLDAALEAFYEVIRKQAAYSLSGNFYDTAILFDYAILREVAVELTNQGYRVAYSDGEIRSTRIFSISWEQ